jgi:hypothetical protein
MFLDFAVHPTMGSVYTFPRRQADLTVQNSRRNPVFVVAGGGGPVNPKGLAAFDREPNIISYQFQINPLGTGEILDDEREEFLCAIDHGLPQLLVFRDDHGEVWEATCVLTGDPHHQMASSNASHVMQASWVMLTDYLHAPATPGSALFGTYFYFGHPPNATQDSNGNWIGGTPDGIHQKFGVMAQKVNFTAGAGENWFQLNNSNTGSTAATTDPVFVFHGPYGSTNPQVYPIKCICSQSRMGFFLHVALRDAAHSSRGDGKPDELLVDLSSRRVLLNGQPAFGVLEKQYATNPFYFSILPDYVNDVVVAFEPGFTPITEGLAGGLSIDWKPKRSN